LAGQGPSRRELLQALTLASAAGAFSGFSRWSYALAEQHILQPAYRPQFFSSSQYQTVERIAELILPATDDAAGKAQPGASEAGVAEFIDFMVFSDPSLQPEFRHGFDHAAAPAPTFFQSAPRSNMRSSNGSPTKPISGKRRKPGNSSSASSAGTQSWASTPPASVLNRSTTRA